MDCIVLHWDIFSFCHCWLFNRLFTLSSFLSLFEVQTDQLKCFTAQPHNCNCNFAFSPASHVINGACYTAADLL